MAKGTLLYGSETVNAKDGSEFIAMMLNGVTIAHMHHLMTPSYSKHMALNELYTNLEEYTDSLAEAFMGCVDSRLAFGPQSFQLGVDPIADIKKLYDYAEQKRGMMGNESHIQNIVDEICSAYATALYKMKQLD